ncbi:V-type ATP synthase subunit I domain-containing protein [Thermococcus peptonophilus]|uniref:ParB-related ThiF-related cassette protein E domain-containing protein n=1 Tax=Thermococcus peptonophilus TaxID=53952 RepID=A0A142CXV4_9EURY|nr:hypothetical protein [Thermococcus peptonophilus]AMQ19606.1 hypothetical protein A0127_10260 [Thermococcus peptonophilus]
MDPQKIIGATIFVLLLFATLGLASNVTTSNGTTSSDQGGSVPSNATLNVSLAEQAYGLLIILEKLSNYTSALISATPNVDNEIVRDFNETEAIRERAWMAYNSSNYQLSIELAMEAMGEYKDIIKELAPEEKEEPENETEEQEELVIEAQAELNRASEYLSYVKEVLNEASQLGIDVSKFIELYNQTAEAYGKVRKDIASGDISSLERDLEVAEDLKDKLSDAIEEELIPQMLSMKSEDIALTFISKLNVQINETMELMNLIENLTQISNVTYPSDYQEEIQDILQDYREELQDIMSQVDELIKEGEYEEALELINNLNDELRDIIDEIREVQKEFYEEYLKEYCEEYREEGSDYSYYERYCERGDSEEYYEEYKEEDSGYSYNESYQERENWEEGREEYYNEYNSTEKYKWEDENETESYEENYNYESDGSFDEDEDDS